MASRDCTKINTLLIFVVLIKHIEPSWRKLKGVNRNGSARSLWYWQNNAIVYFLWAGDCHMKISFSMFKNTCIYFVTNVVSTVAISYMQYHLRATYIPSRSQSKGTVNQISSEIWIENVNVFIYKTRIPLAPPINQDHGRSKSQSYKSRV